MSGIIGTILLYIFIKSAYNLNIPVLYIRAETGTVGKTTTLDLNANHDSMTHKEVYSCVRIPRHLGRE
jgi:hypothetical protein